MKQVFERISDGVLIISYENIIRFCNNVILENLGYSKADIEGNRISLITEEFEAIKNEILSKNSFEDVITLKAKDSVEYDYHVKACSEIIDNEEVIVIIVNKYDEHTYTREDLESYLQNAPFTLMIQDSNGKYTFANTASKKMFKFEEDILGKTGKEVFEPETYELDQKEDENSIKTGKSKLYRKHLTTNSGYSRWLEVLKTPIYNKKGDVKSVVKLIQDITLSSDLEEEISKSYKELSDLDNILKADFNNTNINLISIKRELQTMLGADGINLYLYDKNKKILTSQFRAGVCEKVTTYNNKEITISEDIVRLLRDNIRDGEVINIREIKDKHIRESMLAMGINYGCYYYILFNNEVIGLINALYKDSKDAISVDRYGMKRVCDDIGLIVKSNELCVELQNQLIDKKMLEKELEQFLNTAMDIMCLIDSDDNIIKINKDVEDTLGWSSEEWTNIKWKEIIHPDDMNKTMEVIENCKKNPNTVNSLMDRKLHKNGQYQWMEWRLRYIEDRDVIIATGRNINNIKILEETRAKYERAIELESIKSEFFANISHEFKTPLNIILATMQLIDDGLKNGKILFKSDLDLAKYKKAIIQNSYRLLRLVNNFIDITKIDSGYYKLNLENANFISVVEDITTSVAEYIADKGISLIFDTDTEEQIIACDLDKIERIMLNLISNAIKYSEDKGEINVTINTGKKFVTVTVKDNGIGIPRHMQDVIFQRYMQVDNTFTKRCEGSGIGLALVKSLVELHGGNISVRSEAKKGSEFIFTIPIRTVESKAKIYENNLGARIEKCNIEFSDIYSL